MLAIFFECSLFRTIIARADLLLLRSSLLLTPSSSPHPSHCFAPKYNSSGGFPGSSVGKESSCNSGDPEFNFLGREDPLEKRQATHSSIHGVPRWLRGKKSICNVGDLGSIPGLGRSPGGGHGNLLQYSCLENPHGQRSLAGYSPWGCKELDATEQLSTRGFCLRTNDMKTVNDIGLRVYF